MTNELTTVTPMVLTKRQKLRKWVQRLALAVLILAPLTFVVAAIGYKIGLLDLGVSFGLLNLKVGPLMLLLCLVIGAISLLLAFLIKPRKGIFISALALIVGLAGMMQLGGVKKKSANLPFIHDVSTDTQNPPMFTDAIMSERAKLPKANPANYVGKLGPKGEKLVSVMQVKGYPDIRPVILEEDPDIVFGQALVIAKNLGWKLKTEDKEAGLIEATDTTFWYGFKDDVIIRIKASEGGGTVLDIRSLSRVGGTDLGKNAERIREFVAAIQK